MTHGFLTLDAKFTVRDKPTSPGFYDRIFRNKIWGGEKCHGHECLWIGYRRRDDLSSGLGYWRGDTWVTIEEDTSEWIE